MNKAALTGSTNFRPSIGRRGRTASPVCRQAHTPCSLPELPVTEACTLAPLQPIEETRPVIKWRVQHWKGRQKGLGHQRDDSPALCFLQKHSQDAEDLIRSESPRTALTEDKLRRASQKQRDPYKDHTRS